MPTDPPRLLDELDLAIVHALQLDSRAPWTKVAAAVGVDSATVSRRWEQMSEEALAWLTIWPKPAQWANHADAALVQLDADADIEAILALPWALTVDETSAGVVVLVVSGSGLRELGERVRELSKASAPGPSAGASRMHVVSAVLAEDSMWRTRALSPGGQRILAPSPASGTGRPPSTETVAELAAALGEDPRMPAARLAQRLGVSEATARRTVERAVATDRLGLGCDLSAPAAGLRRGAMLWARSSRLDIVGANARRLPQAHRVLEVVGPAPLCVNVRVTTLTDLPELERALGDEAEIVDRWAVLSVRKRNGHLLDDWGRSIGRVEVGW